MNSIMRKAFLAGLGAVLISEEAAKKVLKDLVKKGEMNEKEARQAIDSIVKKVQKGKVELTKKVEAEVKKVAKKINIQALKDIKSIEIKITKKSKKGSKKK